MENSVLEVEVNRQRILQNIDNNQITFIKSKTGSGKSTLVPKMLHEHSVYQGRRPLIFICQPRRIGAVSLAKYTSGLMRHRMGTICGYHIGSDRQYNEESSLIYCTTGLFLKMILADHSLVNQMSHLIIDEVHERDLNIDFLLTILKDRLSFYKFKLILMSATMEMKDLYDYFSSPSLHSITTLTFNNAPYQVLEYYLDDMEMKEWKSGINQFSNIELPLFDDNLFQVVQSIIEQAEVRDYYRSINQPLPHQLSFKEKLSKLPENMELMYDRSTILIFLPGIYEIRKLFNFLQKLKYRFRLNIIPLHSQLTLDRQLLSTVKTTINSRKIILATNIAESSLTLDDVEYVIDFCLQRTLLIDHVTGITSLNLQWISQSNVEQRRGRCGRTRKGINIRLVSRKLFEKFPFHNIAAFQSAPLHSVVLEATNLLLSTSRKENGNDMSNRVNSILLNAPNPITLHQLETVLYKLKETMAISYNNESQQIKCNRMTTLIKEIESKEKEKENLKLKKNGKISKKFQNETEKLREENKRQIIKLMADKKREKKRRKIIYDLPQFLQTIPITNNCSKLTIFGELCILFPMNYQLSQLIYNCWCVDLIEDGIRIAALLQHRNILTEKFGSKEFGVSMTKYEMEFEFNRKFGFKLNSDSLILLHAFYQLEKMVIISDLDDTNDEFGEEDNLNDMKTRRLIEKYCGEHSIGYNQMIQVLQWVKDVENRLRRNHILSCRIVDRSVEHITRDRMNLLKFAISSAFYPQYFVGKYVNPHLPQKWLATAENNFIFFFSSLKFYGAMTLYRSQLKRIFFDYFQIPSILFEHCFIEEYKDICVFNIPKKKIGNNFYSVIHRIQCHIGEHLSSTIKFCRLSNHMETFLIDMLRLLRDRDELNQLIRKKYPEEMLEMINEMKSLKVNKTILSENENNFFLQHIHQLEEIVDHEICEELKILLEMFWRNNSEGKFNIFVRQNYYHRIVNVILPGKLTYNCCRENDKKFYTTIHPQSINFPAVSEPSNLLISTAMNFNKDSFKYVLFSSTIFPQSLQTLLMINAPIIQLYFGKKENNYVYMRCGLGPNERIERQRKLQPEQRYVQSKDGLLKSNESFIRIEYMLTEEIVEVVNSIRCTKKYLHTLPVEVVHDYKLLKEVRSFFRGKLLQLYKIEKKPIQWYGNENLEKEFNGWFLNDFFEDKLNYMLSTTTEFFGPIEILKVDRCPNN
ncbi:hypothetical protein SNEBB_001848 [Seison nebaliae]|nr:hypothetical protein SNEBB_001848 [Seison nebaliae]